MDSNQKINVAIGRLMHKIKTSPNADKPAFKRALNNLNAARQVQALGYPQFAAPMIQIAHMLVMGKVHGQDEIVQAVDAKMPAVALPDGLQQTISRNMHLIKQMKTVEERDIARIALQHFNLSRVVLGLGYDRLAQFLVRAGERKMQSLNAYARKHYPDDNESDEMIRYGGRRPRPAPPRDPNPVIDKFNRARHSVQTALDKFGIIT